MLNLLLEYTTALLEYLDIALVKLTDSVPLKNVFILIVFMSGLGNRHDVHL